MATPVLTYLTATFILLAYLVVVIFILSGIDDIIHSVLYWSRWVRRWWVVRRDRRLTLERLEAREQQRIAVIIPAWHEDGVIYRMLKNTRDTVRYRNCAIFVGTYPNDPNTRHEVERAGRDFPRVHMVVNPTPGPTTKAQNLNAIYEGIKTHERRTGEHYEIIVTHDAEDIVHPLALLVFNYLIPRKDMIQLPVFPLAVPLREVTHWTYADEFAGAHLRELPVREFMGGFIPSAGVGTAYTRRAFELVWMLYDGEVFPVDSMTEDYSLGLRMRLADLDVAFVLLKLPMPRRPGHTYPRASNWVATQAAFPRTLEGAIRQKTRWNFGIALQSWATEGWPGGPGVRYNLFHDRKVVATSPASFLGYVVLLFAALHELVFRRTDPALPAFVEPGTTLWSLIMLATLLMVWRFIQRMFSVWRIYGGPAAITSIPRAAWANYINFAAVVRALRQFTDMRRTGMAVVWDKTAHEFPSSTGHLPVSLVTGYEDDLSATPPRRPRHWNPQETIDADWDEAALTALERDLRGGDERVVMEMLHRIPRAHGARFLSSVVMLARAASWQVRGRACRVLGFLGLPGAVPVLSETASDGDWVVRANAIRALAKLGDEGERALLVILQGTDRYARELALAMFEQYGAVGRNAERLDAPGQGDRVRAEHFFAVLERHGPSRMAREVLRIRADQQRHLEPLVSVSQR